MKTIYSRVLGGVLASVLGTGVALADVISFDLDTLNFSGFAGPYVKVTVDETGNTAAITFTSYTQGSDTYLMFDSSAFDLNVNSGAFNVTGVTEANAFTTTGGFTPTFDACTINVATGSQVDGLGRFNLACNNQDGFKDSMSSVTFNLTNTDINVTWASAADVLIANANDAVAAAHVGVATNCDSAAGCGAFGNNTGFTGGSGGGGTPVTITVPEPETLLLTALGLLALASVRKRRQA